jgi:hypothetical protein
MAWSTAGKVAAFVGALVGIGLAGGMVARAAERRRKELPGVEDELVDDGSLEWDESWVTWEVYRLPDNTFRVDYGSSTGEGSLCCYVSVDKALLDLFEKLGAPVTLPKEYEEFLT